LINALFGGSLSFLGKVLGWGINHSGKKAEEKTDTNTWTQVNWKVPVLHDVGIATRVGKELSATHAKSKKHFAYKHKPNQ
jgi:hypothetical protein